MGSPRHVSHDAVPAGFRVTGPSRLDGMVIMALEGELDLAGAGELEARLREVERTGSRVVLDMRGLAFMDSTGLNALVACHIRLRAAGVRGPAVVTGEGNVLRLIRMSRLDDVLEVWRDLPPEAAPACG